MPQALKRLSKYLKGLKHPSRKVRSTAHSMLLLAISSLIIPIILFTLVALESYRSEEKRAFDTARQTTQILYEQALKVFEVQDVIFNQVQLRIQDMNWKQISDSQQLHADLKKMIAGMPQIHSIWLVSNDGIVVNSTYTFPLNSDVSNTENFKRQKQEDQGMIIGNPYIGKLTKALLFSTSYRVHSSDGSFNGIILISNHSSYFTSFYQTFIDSNPDTIVLAKQNGVVLVEYPEKSSLPIEPSNNLLKNAFSGLSGEFRFTSPDTGVERFYHYQKLLSYPVYITYGISYKTLVSAWETTLRRYVVFGLPALFFLIAFSIIAVLRARSEANTNKALKTSENRYRTLYSKTPIPLYSLDISGNIVSVSDRWLTLTGYNSNQVIGRSIDQFVFSHENNSLHPEINRKQSGQEEIIDFPLQYKTRDGKILDVLVSSMVERDSAGNFIRTMSAVVDITEKKNAEKALRQAQKMEALGKLTGGVAHDFNNLLTVIVGNAELAAKRQTDERINRLLGNIMLACQRAEGLTKQLLSFSRRQAISLKVLDLKTEIPKIMNLIKPSLKGNISVEVDIEESLWLVEIDSGELEIALLNATVNAKDAMPSGGIFTVGLKNFGVEKGSILNSPNLEGNFVCISLSDTGCGIPPEIIEHVFEPFYTTKDVGRGTGLGLSQIYGFAQQSKGTAFLKSSIGKGTTLFLLIPKTDKILEVEPIATQIKLAVDQKKNRILLVEDNASVSEITQKMLEGIGYKVKAVDRAKKALDIIQSSPDQIDILLTDVVMPDNISGLDLAFEVRKLLPDLPILIISGYNDEMSKGLSFPMLSKPLKLETLANRVAELLSNPVG